MNGRENAAERVCAGQGDYFGRLADLIASSPHNLVSAAERPRVYERHVLESADVARAIAPAGRWMDLGTGGGLPGLVLAKQHPDVAWTLVDATAKKAAAVREFATVLGLTNVTVICARAEGLAWDPHHRGQYAGVVARAVAPLSTLAELARGFLTPGGQLVAIKGPAWRVELQAANRALGVLALEHIHSEPLTGAAREAWVVTMSAVGGPPAGYPRRDGVPKQDPLQ